MKFSTFLSLSKFSALRMQPSKPPACEASDVVELRASPARQGSDLTVSPDFQPCESGFDRLWPQTAQPAVNCQ
ncbi:hypothetical protein HMPREF0972_01047 [Actinomyces sp. oral taxon 848 str. F0332]|nr:hypothetical protein HMPREF0972_01047 [Actinomyces sp. oral taxon 848 str. F0332]